MCLNFQTGVIPLIIISQGVCLWFVFLHNNQTRNLNLTISLISNFCLSLSSLVLPEAWVPLTMLTNFEQEDPSSSKTPLILFSGNGCSWTIISWTSDIPSSWKARYMSLFSRIYNWQKLKLENLRLYTRIPFLWRILNYFLSLLFAFLSTAFVLCCIQPFHGEFNKTNIV